MLLKKKLASQIPSYRNRIKALNEKYGDTIVSEVTVAQAYGGMRGVISMICDTSVVDADIGLVIRGRPIKEIADWLPEAIFWLLLTGEEPSNTELADLRRECSQRNQLPDYVWDVVDCIAEEAHPMTMLSVGILCMQRESVFAKRYAEGMHKDDYWDAALEDALNLLAGLPTLAAGIYRRRYRKGNRIPSTGLDWGADFAHMLGNRSPDFAKLMQLFLVLHCDHEGGNVSAGTAHTVGSALSDPYYAVSAGLNGLAGPLHGLANQECLKYVLEIRDAHQGVPSTEQLKEYAWKTLKAGKVIPGYGHAVLRCPDPRFEAFLAFGKQHCKDDELFSIVQKIYETVPGVLREHGKAKNPQPNVDAASGSLLYHYGIQEFEFYTVFFGVSRAMGLLSQLILNRAIGAPITRPKSVSTDWIEKFVTKK